MPKKAAFGPKQEKHESANQAAASTKTHDEYKEVI